MVKSQPMDNRSSIRKTNQENFYFHLHSTCSKNRKPVEHYISQCYHSAYGATISEFLPLLLELRCTDKTNAVVGLRPANSTPLYLENYLNSPIEQKVAEVLKRPVARCSLIEIGNLSASDGSSRLLFIIMAATLNEGLYKHMVFTATPLVRKLIKRLNCDPILLENAQAERVGVDAKIWGSYYKTQPTVMVLSIKEALAKLSEIPEVRKTIQDYSAVIHQLGWMLRDHRRLCGAERS